MSLRPVCIPCRRFFSVKKNGYAFIEGAPDGNDAPPGTAAPERWHPYKLWVGDLYECKGCGAQIVSGFGSRHIAEHYQPEFKETVERCGATVQVNDC